MKETLDQRIKSIELKRRDIEKHSEKLNRCSLCGAPLQRKNVIRNGVIIATLDEKYITPLVLQEQGYKISEIAATLDISESAVKMRISRAKRMIFEFLEAKK